MSSPRRIGSDPAQGFYEERPLEGLEHNDHDVSQVDETQFADLEIDTQATAGYDEGDYSATMPAQPDLPALQQPKGPKAFTMPDEESDLNAVPGFSFTKAVIKTPVMSFSKRAGERASGPIKDATRASSTVNDDVPTFAPPEKAGQTIGRAPNVGIVVEKPVHSSPPPPIRRTALANTDPNRQLSTHNNSSTGNSRLKSSEAIPALAIATMSERFHPPAPDSIMVAQPREQMLPPFTQVAPQKPASKKGRRKRSAPAALQSDDDTQQEQHIDQNPRQGLELAGLSRGNVHQQYQQLSQPDFMGIDANHSQASRDNMNLNASFSMPAYIDAEPRPVAMQHTTSLDRRDAAHDGPGVVASTEMSPRRDVQAHGSLSSSPERVLSMTSGGGAHSRAVQVRPKAPGTSSLPFPEAAVPSIRRSSPNMVNRPLVNVELATNTIYEPRLAGHSGRVTKRKKSAISVQNGNGAPGQSSAPAQRVQAPSNAIMQQEDFLQRSTVPPTYDSLANTGDDDESVNPLPAVTHPRSAPKTVSNPGVSALDLFDQAKRMLTAQVLEKDRELDRLKLEVKNLAQTVRGLEGNVGQLQSDKEKLRGAMHEKCESLKQKVGELLQDHKVVGGFIEKTSTDIAKFNKYREISGSTFKNAVTKYDILQQHQKNLIEKIHEARVEAASNIAALTKAHNHESETVLKELQAEKKKVSLLEKAVAAEKLKITDLETRHDSDLYDSIRTMFENQNESFAAKVDTHGKELLEAIDNKQEEKTASLKDYLKTLQAYKEHESQASKSIGEVLTIVTALSANVSEVLKSKDAAQDGLLRAGTEILNTIKEKVESISEAQENQAELANRVLHLETSKINLESQLKSDTHTIMDLQSRLEAKSLDLQQNIEQGHLKDQELEALRSSAQQGAVRSGQEADVLRSSLATASQELRELKEQQVKLHEDSHALQAQNSHLKDEAASVAERIRMLQENSQKTADTLKASEDEKSRVLKRAEAADAKLMEVQAKFAEYAASAKQQLEAQRIQMLEDRRRAVVIGQQGALSELSTLKKRYAKLAAENMALKDTIASSSDNTGALEAENTRLQLETSTLCKSHASNLQRFLKAIDSQAQLIDSIKTEMQRVQGIGLSQQAEQLRQLENLQQRYEAGLAGMESRLSHHEEIETKIRAYGEEHNLEYDDTDVEYFLYQVAAKAVDAHRQSLNSSSFSAQISRPSMSFGQSMTAVATTGSPALASQLSATGHRSERRPKETVQVSATPTPRRGHRSPSMPSMVNRAPHVAMVSPPKAKRNLIIAQRRRTLTSSAKPTTPDISDTPVRKPTDRTTGSGGKGLLQTNAPPTASSMFDIPDSSEEAPQQRAAGPRKAGTGIPQSFATPTRPSGVENGRFDSDFSDLTDIMNMMDQNPEVDVIPVLEQQRRERASSTVEDSQSQRGKALAMNPPATPREQPSQELKPLKSILKKRTLSIAQEVEETVADAPPRKQLQPLKGKNSLASLGTGVAGFRSSQDAGPSKTLGFPAREENTEGSAAASQVDSGRPANINVPRNLVMKRTKTMRSFAVESEAQVAPATKKARMSIPYKASSKPAESQRN